MQSLLKDNLLGLKEKLELLEKEIDTKQVVASNNEQRMKDLEKKIEEIVKGGDEIINLNIGGKIFKTKLSTMVAFKDSLFSRLVSNIENKNEKGKEIFIDRSYAHFPKILDYLRTKNISFKGMNKWDKEDLLEELSYYGLDEHFTSKKASIEIGWDQGLSKAGECTVNRDEPNILTVHSRSCYCHFVTNKIFTEGNFQITMESTVTQTDNYFYIGVVNENYSFTGSCGCCNPANSWYIQCDGSSHSNGVRTENYHLAWNGANVTVTMKVLIESKQIYFNVEGKGEVGPYPLSGNSFRVYAGHCNTGNGTITITDCCEIYE